MVKRLIYVTYLDLLEVIESYQDFKKVNGGKKIFKEDNQCFGFRMDGEQFEWKEREWLGGCIGLGYVQVVIVMVQISFCYRSGMMG